MLSLHNTPGAIKEITPGTDALSPRPHYIYVSESGTIDIENEDGTTATVNVVAGSSIQLRPYKVTAATVAIFGVYPS